jgi:hypothetical protein
MLALYKARLSRLILFLNDVAQIFLIFLLLSIGLISFLRFKMAAQMNIDKYLIFKFSLFLWYGVWYNSAV